MTTVTFFTEGQRITGFAAAGHSGFAPEGEDIVCSAVTSTIRLVECVLNDVMGLCAAVRTDEEAALISLRIPGSLGPAAEDTCQNLLAGMMLYLSELHNEYPDYIEVLEAE
ncbi:MAG: ribosomal-processing cysteine protease Prp [Oscillospiraceae bacterium]|nr:ribosomal-processing cysteine protease Prp [Oscillospiraceae bacterium]